MVLLAPPDSSSGSRTLLERRVPYDLEAEEAVLGSLLSDRDGIIKIAPFLKPSDFYREANGWIYAAIQTLYQRREPADPILLAGELDRHGKLEQVGGYAYLFHVVNVTPTAVHVEYYARQVAEASLRRQLITSGGQIAALGFEQDSDITDLLGRVRSLVAALDTGRGVAAWQPLGDLLAAYTDSLTTRETGLLGGVSTGLPDLDDATDGLHAGDFVVVSAPTGGGKSALGLALCLAAAKAGVPTGVISLEMSANQYCQRILSHATGISGTVLRSGQLRDQEWDQVMEGANQYSEFPLYYQPGRNWTLTDVETAAHRLAAEHGCGLLLIDYLQLLNRRGLRMERDDLALEYLAANLKGLAGELGCPIIVPSQLNKEGGTRGSQAIEFAADLHITIEADLDPRRLPPNARVPVDLVIAKQRDGQRGTVSALWDMATNRFLPADLIHTWGG